MNPSLTKQPATRLNWRERCRKHSPELELLGLSTQRGPTNQRELKVARDSQLRRCHPDKNKVDSPQVANAQTQAINEAYDSVKTASFLPVSNTLVESKGSTEDDSKEIIYPKSKAETAPSRNTQASLSVNEISAYVQPIFVPISVDELRLANSKLGEQGFSIKFQNMGLSKYEQGKLKTRTERVIAATEHDVRQRLRSANCPVSSINKEVERRCQNTLVRKTACMRIAGLKDELVENHHYDHLQLERYTLWELVNEVVRIKTEKADKDSEAASTAQESSLEAKQSVFKTNGFGNQDKVEPEDRTPSHNGANLDDEAPLLKGDSSPQQLQDIHDINTGSASPGSSSVVVTQPTAGHPEFPVDSTYAMYVPGKSREGFSEEVICLQLSYETTLKIEFASECCKQNSYDLEKAKADVRRLVKEGKIPQYMWLQGIDVKAIGDGKLS